MFITPFQGLLFPVDVKQLQVTRIVLLALSFSWRFFPFLPTKFVAVPINPFLFVDKPSAAESVPPPLSLNPIPDVTRPWSLRVSEKR